MTKAYGFSAYGGPENQDWFDLPDPTPGPAEVLVRVRAIGVNPVDWKIRGGFGAGDNTDTAFPLVLGVEAAGTVTAVGEDVEGITVGDEVFGRAAQGHGTYSELAVLDGVTAARRPPQVEPAAAASIGVSGVTALVMTEQLALSEGASALVTGAAGSVGVQVLQLLRNRGVATFGVASESKRAMVESLGGVLVPYDGATDVVTAVRELLPDGVDAIYDLVGGDALKGYAALLKTPGQIMSAAAFDVDELGGQRPSQDRPRALFERVVELMAAGDLDPRITDRYPFDEAPAALAAVESGHALGKIVIDLEQTTRT